jgi:hypothetical protein
MLSDKDGKDLHLLVWYLVRIKWRYSSLAAGETRIRTMSLILRYLPNLLSLLVPSHCGALVLRGRHSYEP